MRVVAIIVARGGSRRIPRKNLAPLGRETMLGRKVRQLRDCPTVTEVVVGSDDDEILQEGLACGATPIRRPERFCDEAVITANEMIGNMCELVEADVVLWAHCTNPLISSATYERALASFFDGVQNGYDSLLSVVELREHLWRAEGSPFNYDPYAPRHVLASEIAPFYRQDGGIFIQPHAQMLKNRYFFGRRPKFFETPESEVLDVNTHFELTLARSYIEAVEP